MKINFWNKLTPEEQNQRLLRKTQYNQSAMCKQVANIMAQVKTQGDDALFALTEQLDGVKLTSLMVSPEEWVQAESLVSDAEKEAIFQVVQRVKNHHQAQLPENWLFDSLDGIVCQRLARPIDRVGLYVPGGTAPLVSTVIMLAIPASVVGCKQRVLCTPPDKMGKINPAILVAAKTCGIHQVCKVGGAQAIAAMAYGTTTIPKVDKIFGPGNQWVTQAKMQCVQENIAGIDMPAGPSELLVIADHDANCDFVAADLLSQAEHDVCAQVLLLTPSLTLAKAVLAAITRQLKTLSRQAIITQALENSSIIMVDDILTAIALSNRYGPEHLSLQVENPEQYLPHITCAGTIFMGPWTPEALGDYATGANHVLPTAGFTHLMSGLTVQDFIKTIGVQQASAQGLLKIGPLAKQLAQMEALTAHENAIQCRLNACQRSLS